MGALGDQFRQDSSQQQAAAETVLAKLNEEQSRQVLAIVGLIQARALQNLATLADVLESKIANADNKASDRLQEVRDLNDKIRVAAAKGDWDEFQRLTDSRTKLAEANGA